MKLQLPDGWHLFFQKGVGQATCMVNLIQQDCIFLLLRMQKI